MTKTVWSHVWALNAWTSKKAHNSQLLINLSLDYKYLHASQIAHNKAFPLKPYLKIYYWCLLLYEVQTYVSVDFTYCCKPVIFSVSFSV